MRSTARRWLAAVLCLVMALGLFVPAMAADDEDAVAEVPVGEESLLAQEGGTMPAPEVPEEDGEESVRGHVPTDDHSAAVVDVPVDPAETGDGEDAAQVSSAANPWSHNFSTDGGSSTFFNISGTPVDYPGAKHTLTGDFTQFTKGIAMDTTSEFTFTPPAKGTLSLYVARDTTSPGTVNAYPDGKKQSLTMSGQQDVLTLVMEPNVECKFKKNNGDMYLFKLEFKSEHVHNFGEWITDKAATCYAEGSKHRVCANTADCPLKDNTETEVLAKTAHTPKTIPQVDPTCVKDGKTAEVVCAVEACKAHISGGEVIKATGEHQRDPATGKCTVCGQEVAAPHTCDWEENGTVTKAPTCTEKGKQTVGCKVQHCDKTKEVEIPALDHDLEHHDAVEPVCGKGGHPAYDSCKRQGCGYTTLKPAAHTDADGDGICDVCGGEIAKALTGAGGWFETLYVETNQFAPGEVTAVSWTGASNGKLDRDGLTYLVRAGLNGGKTRIDIPGLKAGKYTVTVKTAEANFQAANVEVMAYDRSGFAHYNYTKGVGAYRDDGVLKDDAIILYVNDQNKDTVTVTSADGTTVTGIGHILNSVGQDTGGGQNSKGGLANGNKGILKKLADDKTPLVVRIIDDVTKPDGLTAFNSADYGGTKGDNGAMARMSAAANVTIEGIGPNASTNGWGFHFIRNTSDMGTDRGTSVEFRNLAFRNVPEDCIGMEGQQSGSTLTAPVERCWVHNCSFFVPNILNPAESDKTQGDGACDFKRGQYMTMSYCHFDGYHKTNLVGSSDTSLQYHITWHHNYWQNCESRGPLGRQANMHIYNNIYENQTSYAMNPRANCYIFSEFNVFDKVKNPMQVKLGAIKSYQDVFSGTSGDEQGTIVTDKAEQVKCANKYANFDTKPESYIVKGDYQLDTITGARQNILAYAGPMKAEIIKAEDIPTEVVDQSRVPKSAVALPYEQALNKAYIAATGEKDNISFDLSGADASFLKIRASQSILFKVDQPVDITIEDGGGTGKAALYNAEGRDLIIGSGKAENLPAGVYFIQSSMVDTSKGGLKEAKIASLSIKKAASTTPPHVHSFTNYVQTVAPTCTKEGTKLATCACGKATDRQAIPMIDHDFSTGVCPTCGALASVLGEVDPNAPEVAVTGVTMSVEGTITLKQGDSQALSATIEPSDATDKSLEWSSSDEAVATVSKKGLVTAKGPGAATITAASANGKSDSVEVTVLGVTTQNYTFNPKTEGPAEIRTSNGEIAVSDWTNTFFSQSGSNKWKAPNYNASKKDYSCGALLLGTGESGSLSFTVSAPASVQKLDITVSSTGGKNTSAVALKNSAGEYLYSVADKRFNTVSGTAAFTVTYTGLSAGTYTIVAPKGVTFAEVEPDSELTDFASAEANPNQRGVWVRSVSVTTAQVVDGEYVAVSDVSLDKSANDVTLRRGDTFTLTATVLPANASNKAVVWSTSDPTVATVAGGIVTCRGTGTATITATAAGGKKATCAITVTAAVGEDIPVSAITVKDAQGKSAGSVTADDLDDVVLQLTADVTPDNATDLSVTWSVAPADAGVVVNSLGKVTVAPSAKSAAVTITATAKDGSGVKGSYTLNVTAFAEAVAVTGVKLNESTLSLKVNASRNLKATIEPANATNKAVTWSSNKTSVATVDENGKVTGKSEGSAEITVTTVDGGFTATCAVTVSKSSGGNGGGSHGGGGGGGGTTINNNNVVVNITFVDVKEDAWYHDSVAKVYGMGLMKGSDDTHFSPEQNTSRAMVATVLYRLDGEKKGDVKELFTDVADGQWYTEAIAWAADKGVVKGYDTNTFAPDENVTREQLAVMLYRYADPGAVSTEALSAKFADAASISDWAAEAIAWAVDKGIMNGKGAGILDPQGLASRAEICTMLVRFVNVSK